MGAGGHTVLASQLIVLTMTGACLAEVTQMDWMEGKTICAEVVTPSVLLTEFLALWRSPWSHMPPSLSQHPRQRNRESASPSHS